MFFSKVPGWCLLLGLVLAITACAGTSPSTRYYVLSSEEHAATSSDSVSEDPAAPLISLGPVVIPSYLDRQQIISRTAPNRLQLQSFHHWAEPIQENITRVLAQNLSGRLETAKVIPFPDRFHDAPDFRVLVEIFRFEAVQSLGKVQLKVRWSVHDARSKHILCDRSSLFARPLPEGPPGAIVAAMSQTLADFSAALARCFLAVRQ